jgi:hypothetical protein
VVVVGAAVDGGAVGVAVLGGEVLDDGVVVGVVDGLVVVGLGFDGSAVVAREVYGLAQAPAVSASTASAATTLHDRGRLMGSLFLVENERASRAALTSLLRCSGRPGLPRHDL